jgi:flagellin-like hook-associated protein FlgL
MSSNTYKGKNVFVDTANSEFVSMGGREAEMTFGIGTFDYSELYGPARTVATGLPNAGANVHLTFLPSDAVFGPEINHSTVLADGDTLQRGKTYVVHTDADDTIDNIIAAQSDHDAFGDFDADVPAFFTMDEDAVIGTSALDVKHALGEGQTYEFTDIDNLTDADKTAIVANSNLTSESQIVVGMAFTMTADLEPDILSVLKTREIDANAITNRIESVQKKINTARVQAGSQYAALESAVNYTTDLTAQYELAYNTVHDVNFSMETAHLAKNQILQQAATAMLAQANQGQQGLLPLIT